MNRTPCWDRQSAGRKPQRTLRSALTDDADRIWLDSAYTTRYRLSEMAHVGLGCVVFTDELLDSRTRDVEE